MGNNSHWRYFDTSSGIMHFVPQIEDMHLIYLFYSSKLYELSSVTDSSLQLVLAV